MGKYEVTQAQWQAVMGSNPSKFKGSNLPVEEVSWNDCQEFIRKLNTKGQGTFRLPTEAEWEYACRAGTTTPFHFGETISTDQANYDGNYTYGNGRKGVYRERDGCGREFSGKSLGPARHARERVGVVRGPVWGVLEQFADRSPRAEDGRPSGVAGRVLERQARGLPIGQSHRDRTRRTRSTSTGFVLCVLVRPASLLIGSLVLGFLGSWRGYGGEAPIEFWFGFVGMSS